MSGSGEYAGGAAGEKSRGGSVTTERGVPNAALTSAALARVGIVTAAPNTTLRRLKLVITFLRVISYLKASMS